MSDITTDENTKIGLVVMASGLGKRFGGNKLMEVIGDKPIIKWVLDSTKDLFDKRVVVTRHKDVKELCDSLNMDCILHDFTDRNDTVRLGLNSLIGDIDYCFFTVGDQPLLSRESFIKLINEAKNKKTMITRACCGQIEGSPVGFPKELFDELLNLPRGKGGNFIANNNPTLINRVEVIHEYELKDIDTIEDISCIMKYIYNINK